MKNSFDTHLDSNIKIDLNLQSSNQSGHYNYKKYQTLPPLLVAISSLISDVISNIIPGILSDTAFSSEMCEDGGLTKQLVT